MNIDNSEEKTNQITALEENVTIEDFEKHEFIKTKTVDLKDLQSLFDTYYL